jgi:hypothetical protein
MRLFGELTDDHESRADRVGSDRKGGQARVNNPSQRGFGTDWSERHDLVLLHD